MILEKNGEFYVLLMELKSYVFNRKKGVEPKLINSRLFVEYVLQLAEKNFGLKIPLDNIANVLFYLKKGKSNPRKVLPYEINAVSQKYNEIKVYEISKFSANNFSIHIDQLIEKVF